MRFPWRKSNTSRGCLRNANAQKNESKFLGLKAKPIAQTNFERRKKAARDLSDN